VISQERAEQSRIYKTGNLNLNLNLPSIATTWYYYCFTLEVLCDMELTMSIKITRDYREMLGEIMRRFYVE